MSSPAQDPELWVESALCSQRDWLIEGNSHTCPGRLAIWCPHTEQGYELSKDEVLATSTAGGYWIRGFVVGSEPGSPVTKNGYEKPETSRAFRAWDGTRSQYIATGNWPPGAPHRS